MTESDTNSIIEGLLLSDGCITRGGTKNYYLDVTSKYEEYIDYLRKIFPFHTNKTRNKPRGDSYIKGNLVRNRGSFSLRTRSDPLFTGLRKEWYPNGHKIVPRHLLLDPSLLLHWFIGDGSLDNKTGIVLCTDSFNQRDIKYLSQLLTKIGFRNRHTRRNRILIPTRLVRDFLDFMGKCPVACFLYKWKSKIKESYYGRTCPECGRKFDAVVNKQRFCSEYCYKKNWKKLPRPYACGESQGRKVRTLTA